MAKAPIDGNTLRWARTVGGVTVEELARATGTRPARIAEFEAGDNAPTFRQLGLIAGKLDRPLGFFFAPAPRTSDVPETADFRGRDDDIIPADLAREMKRAEQHRETMLDLGGDPVARLELGRITFGNVAERADELRARFGLTRRFVPPESQANQVFNFWRGLLERQGVLVFQTTRIALTTFRGLSIHHDTLPIVVLNGADAANGKVFTLFHEVAHLVNRTSGLCVLDDNVNEEALANRFAANFLMPAEPVRSVVQHGEDPTEAAERLAATFKVSVLAAAVRLKTLDLIDEDDLAGIRRDSDEAWEQARQRQRESDGFVPQWRLRYRDLGSQYIGAVAHALEDRRIDLLDATYLLNARLPMVEQLLDEYYRSGGEE